MAKEAPKYHYFRKRQATFKAVLRGAMAAYLAYLAFQLFMEFRKGTSSMPGPLTLLISVVFFAVAIAIGIYDWRHYKVDLKDALLTPEERAQMEEEP